MRILASVLLLVTARMAAETEAFRDERPVFPHAPAQMFSSPKATPLEGRSLASVDITMLYS